MSDELKRGLEGVLVAESGLSHVNGEAGKLVYRGYDIEDLAREASYEEVLYLLWHGSLPTREEFDAFAASLAAEREVETKVLEAVEVLANGDERPMAALRTATSMLSAYDDDEAVESREETIEQGARITAKIPTVLAAFERARQGEEPIDPDPDLSHAGNFLYMLTGVKPDDVSEETFDMALTLHADHGLNASTFTAMVIGSTLADTYSGVTGGIGALSGSLHGGANQDVMELLYEIRDSEKDPVQWVKDAREDGRRIPGFGHRVYKVKDPRARILEEKLRDLASSSGDDTWLEYTTAIEEYLTEEGLVEKGIAPNVDFYSGSVYDTIGIPMDLFTPIFAMSRVGGWVAHVAEYQADNRLIRPRARYTGPTSAEFVPIDER
ncbi:MAG: citrate synthase [Halorubrum sp.]